MASSGQSSSSASSEQGTIVPTRGNEQDFTVIWQNLSFKANPVRWYDRANARLMGVPLPANANTRRVILDQICGDIKSRQLTAIMGPSGAGKSTLLHCLFQNRTVGTSGRILVDSKSSSKLKVCFIPQHDYLNEWLTVREDLMFVSKLKLAQVSGLFGNNHVQGSSDTFQQVGRGTPIKSVDHEANALRVADLLGLCNCLDVPIKRISGGQKKRLSIARELMSKPDILILDEPTTGLDSLTCYKTVGLLRDLAHLSPHPMAVVATIHQPQIEVFNLFDKTYFISNRGRVIYSDEPRSAAATIESVGQIKMPQNKFNPASLLIEIASGAMHENVIEKLSNHQKTKFGEKYNASYLLRLTKVHARRLSFYSKARKSTSNDNQTDESPTSETTTFVEGSQLDASTKYHISYKLKDCLSSHSSSMTESFRHVSILTHRSWLSVIRNPTFTRTRLLFHTLLPLMMLVVYGNKMGSPNNCPKVQFELEYQDMTKNLKDNLVRKNIEEARLGAENLSFFFILMYGFAINLISCTASFYPLTMHMFKKEVINGLYTPGPYFVGQMLAELPLEMIFPSISIVLAYQLSGQQSSYLEWRMISLAFTMFLICYSIHSLGLLCGSIFVNHVEIAVLFGQLLLLPFVMLSGFLIREVRMSTWMQRLSYLSPFKHGMGAVLAARYGFNVCECDDSMLPEGGVIELSGMNPQIKHVLDYMFPKNESTGGIAITEMFETLGQRFVKSQTFALELKSCDDVKPFLMHIFTAEDSSLYYGICWLFLLIFVYKFTTFCITRSFPYRI